MTRIRKLEIRNFRSIGTFDWFPTPGINCLIGPGDSGKSTILDAIDLCLGARKSAPISDTDFLNLDITHPISITATLGDLPDALKNIDVYGDFLRAFDPQLESLEDEPRTGWETVISVNVTIDADLEPAWSLVSPQAQASNLSRGLRWADRLTVAPARLGAYLSSQLGWTRGSVLNRLSEDPVQLGPQLAQAARQARTSFGNAASAPLKSVLDEVGRVAQDLGIPLGAGAQALLDAHSVSIGDGAVALHNGAGIPLRSLGAGSARLLVAGLQRAASIAGGSSIVLVDEVETGLEPHRLQRLLISLGAKEDPPPLQVFMTTHSPVAVRELSAKQLWPLRMNGPNHSSLWAGYYEEAQATARATPEALLARKIILCEGASEVGLIRGLDTYWSNQGHKSLLASGAIAVSVGGSFPEKGFDRGVALQKLGYHTFVLVDGDKPIKEPNIAAHTAVGGQHIHWEHGHATEHVIFLALDQSGIDELLQRAADIHGRQVIESQVLSYSGNQRTLQSIEGDALIDGYQPADRLLLALAAHKSGWFKTQTHYEAIATDIIGPRYVNTSEQFRAHMVRLFGWAHAA